MLTGRPCAAKAGASTMRPMKVVHVETGRRFYGGAQQVMYLLQGLTACHIDCLLICPPGSGIDAAARKAGIAVENVDCAGDLDLGFARRLRSSLRRVRPDLVHCHSRRGADVLGGYAAAMSHVPALVTRRVDSIESRAIAYMRYRPFRKVIAISENVAAALIDSGLRQERLEIIRSAVDVGQVPDSVDRGVLQREFGVADDEVAIAMVAQMIPRKGHRSLMDVIPNLRDTNPKFRVVLFGDGPLDGKLRGLAKQLNLDYTLQFAGFRDDLDGMLGAFDILVHPARKEGLGVAMLKAAAAGVPVVAFDVAGAREAVVHCRTGLLVPPRDLRMLQKALAVLIDEPDTRQAMGRAGRERMRMEFTVETMVEQHIELYEAVLDDPQ